MFLVSKFTHRHSLCGWNANEIWCGRGAVRAIWASLAEVPFLTMYQVYSMNVHRRQCETEKWSYSCAILSLDVPQISALICRIYQVQGAVCSSLFPRIGLLARTLRPSFRIRSDSSWTRSGCEEQKMGGQGDGIMSRSSPCILWWFTWADHVFTYDIFAGSCIFPTLFHSDLSAPLHVNLCYVVYLQLQDGQCQCVGRIQVQYTCFSCIKEPSRGVYWIIH